MASDFISIITDDKNATHARQLISAVEAVRNAKVQLEKINALGEHMFGGEDFALYQTKFGIPNDQGKQVFSMVEQVNELLANPAVADFIDRIG